MLYIICYMNYMTHLLQPKCHEDGLFGRDFLLLRPGMMEISKMHERLRSNHLFSDPSTCPGPKTGAETLHKRGVFGRFRCRVSLFRVEIRPGAHVAQHAEWRGPRQGLRQASERRAEDRAQWLGQQLKATQLKFLSIRLKAMGYRSL